MDLRSDGLGEGRKQQWKKYLKKKGGVCDIKYILGLTGLEVRKDREFESVVIG